MGDPFLAYVEQVLVPTLRMRDIVFMDNVRTHKVAGAREAIEAAGAELRYLPAYSPDLNPSRMPMPRSSRTCAKRRPHRLRTLEAGRTQREGDCTLRDPTSDNGPDRSLISFMGNLSVFAWLLLGSYIISRLHRAILKSACRPPRRHANSDPVRSLANTAILPSFAGCRCGVPPGLMLFGLSPNRRGGVAVTPSAFSGSGNVPAFRARYFFA